MNPGEHLYEKMISGMFLGEIARLVASGARYPEANARDHRQDLRCCRDRWSVRGPEAVRFAGLIKGQLFKGDVSEVSTLPLTRSTLPAMRSTLPLTRGLWLRSPECAIVLLTLENPRP